LAEIVFESPRFGSEGDERALFEWLERIEGVTNVMGHGTKLTIEISEPVSDSALRELIGAFSRYGIEMSRLARLETDGNREWFRAPGAFWHDEVFGRG